MFSLIKLFFHCLWGTIRLKSCCMCYQTYLDGKKQKTRHFCSCGYLNNQVDWETLKKEFRG
jgi:hypothetical protein